MKEANIRSGIVSRIEPDQRDPERLRVFLDSEFAFGVSRLVAVEYGLHEGQQLSAGDVRVVLEAEEVSRATDAALQFLALRPRSRREVETRLARRGFSPSTAGVVISRLLEWSYLDDKSFARYWVENRAEHQPRSKRLLSQELRLKGVDPVTIEQTLAAIATDESSDALGLARRRLERLSSLEPDIQRRRLASYLHRRGYGWDVTRSVLNTLLGDNADDPSGE